MFRTLLTRYVFDGLEVTDAEIEAWYDEHADEHVEPVKIKLAIALLETEQEAADFLDQVRSGDDFGELAVERSKDRQTAAHRGVAGWVSAGRAIPELRREPFEQPAGAVGAVPLHHEVGSPALRRPVDRVKAVGPGDVDVVAVVPVQRLGVHAAAQHEACL